MEKYRGLCEDGRVFPVPNYQSCMDSLKRLGKKCGITKPLSWHCFRHSYATLQLAGGTDIYTVSKMLGHTNVKTTQIYTKVIDAKKEKAAETIKLDLSFTE